MSDALAARAVPRAEPALEVDTSEPATISPWPIGFSRRPFGSIRPPRFRTSPIVRSRAAHRAPGAPCFSSDLTPESGRERQRSQMATGGTA